jgi:hypothetical protein
MTSAEAAKPNLRNRAPLSLALFHRGGLFVQQIRQRLEPLGLESPPIDPFFPEIAPAEIRSHRHLEQLAKRVRKCSVNLLVGIGLVVGHARNEHWHDVRDAIEGSEPTNLVIDVCAVSCMGRTHDDQLRGGAEMARDGFFILDPLKSASSLNTRRRRPPARVSLGGR